MSNQQSPAVTPTPAATKTLPGTPKSQQQQALQQRKTNTGLSAKTRKDDDTLSEHQAQPAPHTHPTQQQYALTDESPGENVQGVADSIHAPYNALDSTEPDPKIGDKRNRSKSDVTHGPETNDGNTIPAPNFVPHNPTYNKGTRDRGAAGRTNLNPSTHDYNKPRTGYLPPTHPLTRPTYTPPPPRTGEETTDLDSPMTNEHLEPHNEERQEMFIDDESGLEYTTPPTSDETKKKQVDLYILNMAKATNVRRRLTEAPITSSPQTPATQATILVATPEDGWPEVHAASAAHIYAGVDHEQLEKILTDPGAAVVVQVFGENSWDGKAGTVAEKVADTIKTIFNVESLAMAPANEELGPEGKWKNTHRNDPPHTFFVQDLSQTLADKLILQTCIATKNIRMLIYPLRHMGPSKYLGSIHGLISSNLVLMKPDRKRLLCEDISDIFRAQAFNVFMDYGMRNIRDEDDLERMEWDPRDEANNILADVYVKVLETKALGGKITATVNMYLDLPDPDASFRQNIIDKLATLDYKTTHFGTGTYSAGWQCHHCRGIDHPFGMCPYLALPGWEEITKPTPTQSTEPPANSNRTQRPHRGGQSSGNYGSGRGYGRGNGNTRGRGRGQAGWGHDE